MDIRRGIVLAALGGLLCACTTLSGGDKPAAGLTGRPRACVTTDHVRDQPYYQASKQAYLDAGMDDELSTYLATTATAITTCIWDEEFNRFYGRTCALELDFSGPTPVRRFTGDRPFCAFLKQHTDALPIPAPPASYLRQHQDVTIEFTPG